MTKWAAQSNEAPGHRRQPRRRRTSGSSTRPPRRPRRTTLDGVTYQVLNPAFATGASASFGRLFFNVVRNDAPQELKDVFKAGGFLCDAPGRVPRALRQHAAGQRHERVPVLRPDQLTRSADLPVAGSATGPPPATRQEYRCRSGSVRPGTGRGAWWWRSPWRRPPLWRPPRGDGDDGPGRRAAAKTAAPVTVPARAPVPAPRSPSAGPPRLVNQTVAVSWAGFRPSSATRLQNAGDSLDVNTENPVRVYQCRGDRPGQLERLLRLPGVPRHRGDRDHRGRAAGTGVHLRRPDRPVRRSPGRTRQLAGHRHPRRRHRRGHDPGLHQARVRGPRLRRDGARARSSWCRTTAGRRARPRT